MIQPPRCHAACGIMLMKELLETMRRALRVSVTMEDEPRPGAAEFPCHFEYGRDQLYSSLRSYKQ